MSFTLKKILEEIKILVIQFLLYIKLRYHGQNTKQCLIPQKGLHMKRLYAPWRHDYVTRKDKNPAKKDMKNECVFCEKFSKLNDDDNHFIIKRFKCCVVAMNYYPYNAGHLLVISSRHAGNLKDLSSEERIEMIEVANASILALEQTLNAKGFNLGINQGTAAQGSIPEHLHIHILPRWHGDTSFLETLAETTIISSDLFKCFESLKKYFQALDF